MSPDFKSDISRIRLKCDKAKAYYHSQTGKQQVLLERKAEIEAALQSASKSIDTLDHVRVLLSKVSEYAREHSKQQIEALVTNCLQFIFDSGIEFKIEISEMSGKPEAEFFIARDINGAKITTRPCEARGGGVVDIVSLALRVAMIECSSTGVNGPIILDEPAKHVSDEYISQVAEFLKQVCEMFGRQVIMVTHNKHLSEIADQAFRVELHGGISVVA